MQRLPEESGGDALGWFLARILRLNRVDEALRANLTSGSPRIEKGCHGSASFRVNRATKKRTEAAIVAGGPPAVSPRSDGSGRGKGMISETLRPNVYLAVPGLGCARRHWVVDRSRTGLKRIFKRMGIFWAIAARNFATLNPDNALSHAVERL